MKTATHLGASPSKFRKHRQASLCRAVVETVEPRRLLAATLDSSYGNGGSVEFGDGMNDFGNASSVVLPDGKVLTVSDYISSESLISLHRAEADGTPDASFGNNGTVTLDLGTGDNSIGSTSLAAAADGSVYLAGVFSDPNVSNVVGFVAHISADGSLDAGYGNGVVSGLAFFAAENLDVQAPHLAPNPDGTLYVGYTTDNVLSASVSVTKLDANGAPISSYSNGGTARFAIPGTGGNLGQIALRGTSLLLVGDTFATTLTDSDAPDTFVAADSSIFTAVLDAAGTLTPLGDSGADGVPDGFGLTVIDNDDSFDVNGIAITSDGGLVVGGNLSIFDQTGLVDVIPTFAKFGPSYALVPGFGTGGVVQVDTGTRAISLYEFDEFNDRVIVDAQGRITAIGSEELDADASQYDLAVIRLTSSGALDAGFDGDGIFTFSRTDSDFGTSIVPTMSGAAYVSGLTAGFDVEPRVVVLKFAGAVAPPVNHAPTVASVAGPAGTTQTAQSATFTATFADIDAGDSLEVAWNFGDGNTLGFAPAAQPTASASHAYAAAGTYTVTFMVRDASGAIGTGTTTITVVTPPPPVPYTLINGKLALTATAGNDTVSVTKNGSGQVVITNNGTPYTVTGAVTSIVLDGGNGNDTLKVSTAFTIPATLIGGAGNDTVRGGNGADVLIGDAGNDTLIGRNGRDMVVGGIGADLLIGNEQDDILISGTTSYASTNFTAYSAIMAEWTSNRSYSVRLINLLLPVPILPHANGNYYLTPFINVFDDNSVDTVVGGTGDDLPLVTILGPNRDVINDGQTNFAASILALINGD
jgi:uncharacterized delta-60 repeat protein